MVSIDKDQGKKKLTEVKTFSVPFALEEIKENITINTHATSKSSKEKIINKAIQFHLKGNIKEATKYYQYCINQGFNDHRVFSNYGSILKDLGHLKEAETSTRKAIELKPDYADAYSNLGIILKNLGNLQEAEISTRKAIELKPDYADAYSNLGIILKNLGNLQEAEISTSKAIELKPDFAIAYTNLGNIFLDLGQLQESEKSYRKAIELKPDYADAYSNLSYLELLKSDYKFGLENYEFRFKKEKPSSLHGNSNLKRITNKTLQKGEKILVVSEQGLGDTFQYMRYIPYLRNKGFEISFCTLEKLHSLIQVSNIESNPLSPQEINSVTTGQWIPLLSLPRILKVSPKNPIVTKPYIHSKKELNKKWKTIFAQEKRPIIGINWQGAPDTEKTYQGRSIPLETFSIISDKHEIRLLSLQKGFGSEQLDNCSFKNNFVNCQPQIDSTWDFLENAAIIENCDLIITCDTSVAHLAGGMGKKVWLLLRDIPFWTWGLEGSSTFWYPSMRLFRQKERHNWQEVMERVSSAITEEFNPSKSSPHAAPEKERYT
ncbi:tetratricopeptide repeat-containing glycosyltransferase family protein [Prochlorococcus marinus]|uniref:tetratricopeptide repeat-containing glycosyltransferase family protein n=1 Tax=Prochlorococcus marinus TaxID=1219 RepID=UPI0022B43EF1|nr:tetratricopeptide repeat-containing glycosyltransferase family protein [Prochlorococcus marinus]